MKKVVIEFSKNGEGAILTQSFSNTLRLYKLDNPDIKVGDRPKEAYHKGCLAELVFYKTESIDCMIEQLEKIKENMLILSAC